MTRSLAFAGAVIWVMLWGLMSLVENMGYIHDPATPLWQLLAIVSPSLAVAATIVGFLLWGQPFERLYGRSPSRWLLVALAFTPVLVAGDFIFSMGVRTVLFAVGGAAYRHRRWWDFLVYDSIKVSLLYAIWVGLAFGGKAFGKWQEERTAFLEIEKAAAEAKLGRLQEQLRPHFLFNALNTISALMRTDVDRADRLLTQLADFFRATLTAGERDLVPLSEELRLLRLYAAIMCERFADRVEIDWRVSESVLQMTLPRMMLQPLLENAFRHGVEELPGPQTIVIEASARPEILEIKIRSSGHLPDQIREGVGLANCRERLRIYYGASAGITLEREAGAIVSARLVVPAQGAAA